MERKERYSMILLAGGKSSRMGCNKAELVYQEKSFVDNLIEKAGKLGIENIFLSGFEQKEKQPADNGVKLTTVWDRYPQRGPLGGIHACMEKITTPYALVLPVDVPQIPLEVLEELFCRHDKICLKEEQKGLPFLIKHGERQENLMGIYPVTMLAVIEDRIREHAASVHGLLEEFGAVWCSLEVEEWQLENINTKENYQQLLLMK